MTGIVSIGTESENNRGMNNTEVIMKQWKRTIRAICAIANTFVGALFLFFVLCVSMKLSVMAGEKMNQPLKQDSVGRVALTSSILLRTPEQGIFWQGAMLPYIWKFHEGDNPAFASPALNDRSWSELPAMLMLKKLKPQDWQGIGWFRLHIVIDSTLRNQAVALLMYQKGASEVYLNGRLVQQYGIVSTLAAQEQRFNPMTTPIALQFGDVGEYVLAVRYSNTQAFAEFRRYVNIEYSDMAGFEVHLKALNQAFADDTEKTRFHAVPSLIAFGVLATLTLIHLFLFIFYPQQKANLFFSLFSATVLFRFFVNYYMSVGTDPALFMLFNVSQYVYTTVLSGFYLAFLYAIFYPVIPRRIWLIAVLCLVCSTLLVTFGTTKTTGLMWTLFLAGCAFEGLRVVIMRGILQRQSGAWILAFGVLDYAFMWLVRSGMKIFSMLGWSQSFMDMTMETQELVTFAGYMSLPFAMSVYIALYVSRTNRNLARQLVQIRQLSERTLEQERIASEQAIRQTLLEADNSRKTHELEEARALQLSMLPKSVPEHPGFEIAAYMETATEVGGDYYDFKIASDGTLVAVVGDATGHGMKAGFLVSATKSYVQTLTRHDNGAELLQRISRGIRNMNMRGMYMCLTIVKLIGRQAVIAVAGMPPILLYRAKTRTVDRLLIKALPLGSIADFPYTELTVPLEDDDVLLMMSDGLPELFNAENEVLDYERIEECFREVGSLAPHSIIAALLERAGVWSQGGIMHDDMTIVVLKVKPIPVPTSISNGHTPTLEYDVSKFAATEAV